VPPGLARVAVGASVSRPSAPQEETIPPALSIALTGDDWPRSYSKE